MEVAIIGIGIHKFGRFPGKTYVDMGRDAVLEALKDANVTWGEIEAAFCSSVFAGSASGAYVLGDVGLSGIPIVDVEAACAAGGFAIRQGVQAIQHGIYDLVLVAGFEKMPRGFIVSPRFQEWERRLGLASNPMFFALWAQRYMYEYGITESQLVKVSVKNHRNGALNPNALYQRALTFEEIANSPMVCDPIRLLMLCAPDEGAAALVMCSKDRARRYTNKPIIVAATEARTPLHPMHRLASPHFASRVKKPSVTERTAQAAYGVAGIGPEDLDVVELQDQEAASELRYYEELGLCNEGEGGRLIDEGATEINGRIPVNTSGGLLSKGEPVGASAIGQMHELVLQLRGEAGLRQVKDPRVVLSHVFGAGGNCAVTILKK